MQANADTMAVYDKTGVRTTVSDADLATIAGVGSLYTKARCIHTGASKPMASTDGSDYTVVATEVIYAECQVPLAVTATGVALFNGSAVAGNVKVGLYKMTSSTVGTLVATSAGTAQSGTDAYQLIPFTAAVDLVPGAYVIAAIGDTGGGTSKINTHTIGAFAASKLTGQAYATGFPSTLTPATTFTTALGPMASLY